jgi:hypothetical protein
MAVQQWNQINLPSKVPAGTVPVIGMSPNYPSDHVILMEDGNTLYESQDGGSTWNDMESVHQNYNMFYGAYSTAKTPTARIYIPPNFDSSHGVVWCINMANDFYQVFPARRADNLVTCFKEKSTTPPPPPGPVSSVVYTILLGFAFGPDSTMYIAGGAEIYSGNRDPAYYVNNPGDWNALCFVDSYVYDIEVSPNFSNDLTMMIQTDDRGVLISTNGGQNFTQTSLPVTDGYYYMRFSPNYANDGTIAVVVPDAGLFLSTDRGTDWKNVLPGMSVTAAAIGPSGAIYAGTDYTYGTQNGVYASFDQGRDWQNIGLEGSEISSLYVFKGASGDQVYAVTDSGLAWTVVNHPVSLAPSPAIGPASVRFVIGQDDYTVDGSVYQTDAAPYIENGRAYVPLCYLASALNMALAWDRTTQAIKLSNGEKSLAMAIGAKQVTIGDENEVLNYPPVIKEGRTYLMARLLETYLNYNVSWDGQNRAVTVSVP